MWKKKCKDFPIPQPKVVGRVGKTLGLPEEVLAGLPEIELHGNLEAIVENCQTVLEYCPEKIRLRAGILNIEFSGRNLCMTCMTDENVIISGYIMSVQLSRQGV